MGLSNKLSCEAGSFSCCCNPHRFLQLEVFEAFFSFAGTWGCTVCLTPQFFLPVYLHANVGPPGLPAANLPGVLSAAAHLCPSYQFFFNSFIVGLSYSSIFWQFWSFFVFKFIVVLLLVVQGGKVYLPTPPSWLEVQLCPFSI